MERALRLTATSLLVLGTITAARGQGSAVDPGLSGDDAVCEAGSPGPPELSEARQARCQELWRQRVEAARQRSLENLQRTLEERRQRLEREANLPPPPPPPVKVESFLGRDDLAYGDVVVTDKGPRVFIGKGEAPPSAEDFVALDSPLSPHRGNVRQYDGAFPGGPPPSAKPRPAPRKSQERQP